MSESSQTHIPDDAFLLNPGAAQQYSREWRQGSANSGLYRTLALCIALMIGVALFVLFLTGRFYVFEGQDNTGAIFFTVLLAGSGIFFVATTGLVIGRQRDEVLKQEQMLTGTIRDFRASTVGGEYTFKLTYTFTSPHTGREVRQVLVDTREDLRGTPPPAPGTPVIVLYRSDADFKLL